MSTQTTNFSNVWQERAMRVAIPGEPMSPNKNGHRQTAPAALPAPLAALKLTAEEVRSLLQKGLHSGQPNATASKEVFDLVQLALPDGRSVLLGMVHVTPALAAQWLKTNFGNRTVSDDTVTAYARDIANGEFVMTHQGIAFNDRDELIDGQHFLHAVIKSGLSCVRMVSFGWPSKIEGKKLTTMDCVDRGRTRSIANQLQIQHGLKNATAIAQLATQLANLCCPERMRRLSVGQALTIFHEFEPTVLWVIDRRAKQPGLKSAGVLAAFAFALRTETIAPALLDDLNAGTGLKPGSSIHALRDFLVGDDARLLQRTHDRGIAELTLKALLDLPLEPGLEGVKHFAALQKERVEKIAKLFELPKGSTTVPVVPAGVAPGGPESRRDGSTTRETRVVPSPSLDAILAKVAMLYQCADFIILGKGTERDIEYARDAFITAALAAGHSEIMVAEKLKRSIDTVRILRERFDKHCSTATDSSFKKKNEKFAKLCAGLGLAPKPLEEK